LARFDRRNIAVDAFDPSKRYSDFKEMLTPAGGQPLEVARFISDGNQKSAYHQHQKKKVWR
jgi:hypothetical protein